MRPDVVDAAIEAACERAAPFLPLIYLDAARPSLRSAAGPSAGRRSGAGGAVRPLRRPRRTGSRGARVGGDQSRRFRSFGRRTGGDRDNRRLRAIVAGRHRRRRSLVEESFEAGPSRVPAIYATPRVAGPRGTGGVAVRPSRADSRVAAGGGGKDNPRAAARYVGPLCREDLDASDTRLRHDGLPPYDAEDDEP